MHLFVSGMILQTYKKLRCFKYIYDLLRLALGLFTVSCLLVLSACDTGSSPSLSGHGNSQPGSTSVPRRIVQASPTDRDVLPSPAPTDQNIPPSPTSLSRTAGVVSVTTDKLSYTDKSTLFITVTNASANDIYLSAYYSNCTPVQLQVKGVSWTNVGTCPERTQSTQVLQAGDAVVFQLHPAAPGGLHPVPLTAWTPGLYRIFLTYALQPDPDSARGGPALTSGEFVIYK